VLRSPASRVGELLRVDVGRAGGVIETFRQWWKDRRRVVVDDVAVARDFTSRRRLPGLPGGAPVGMAPYAQVRMADLIDAFEERRPDPDGGRNYRRLMTSLTAAPEVLGWGEPAVAQAKATARVAEEVWGLPVGAPAPAGYVD
jgi:hypothetical protein